ncbi:hypothetical protein [Flavobacterium cyclinae]|uniref:hypothetical protein n=1 Tax=Flavobacterium cyclinae TaxID=2895947 RepID=UPI001E54119D|nr:hypothetical protein [Flavobacterium cyclinae]UGS22318.1 hypothetical protein LOS86_06760 [Flavobacterium cyclinae]
MINKIKDYTNEELIDVFINFWDENDAVHALSELSTRKHPRTEEFCKVVFERGEFDEFDKGVGISIYYSYNENRAIEYAKNNYKNWHIITLGKLISELWQDSEQENSEKKKELIKLVKAHLKTLKRSEIKEIQDDYDAFMKAYKWV